MVLKEFWSRILNNSFSDLYAKLTTFILHNKILLVKLELFPFPGMKR